MFVGFLTTPLRDWNLKKIVDWASSSGFEGLEVLVSPAIKHIDINKVLDGWGGIGWRAYITALKEAKYDYVLSIEHEDPFFGTEDGLISGEKYLENII